MTTGEPSDRDINPPGTFGELLHPITPETIRNEFIPILNGRFVSRMKRQKGVKLTTEEYLQMINSAINDVFGLNLAQDETKAIWSLYARARAEAKQKKKSLKRQREEFQKKSQLKLRLRAPRKEKTL